VGRNGLHEEVEEERSCEEEEVKRVFFWHVCVCVCVCVCCVCVVCVCACVCVCVCDIKSLL
jgi:hypothetical protein